MCNDHCNQNILNTDVSVEVLGNVMELQVEKMNTFFAHI